MSNIKGKTNLFITTIICILCSITTVAHAENTKFELKKTIKKESSPKKEKPLFDLLNSNAPQQKNNTQNEDKWGNNPFFSQQPKMAMPEKIPSTRARTQEERPLWSYSTRRITIKLEPKYDHSLEIGLKFYDHNLEIEYDINSARNSWFLAFQV